MLIKQARACFSVIRSITLKKIFIGRKRKTPKEVFNFPKMCKLKTIDENRKKIFVVSYEAGRKSPQRIHENLK